MTRRERAAVLGLSAALSVALAGCGSGRAPVADIPRYVDGSSAQGPLSASAAGGGFAADPADHAPWQHSFGQFFLCVTNPGVEATITDVVPDVSRAAPPLAVKVWLRETTDAAVRRTARRHRADFEGINSIGSPPDWADPERVFFARGKWSTKVAGTRITATCQQYLDQQTAVTAGRVPSIPKVYELVLTLKVGRGGGAVNGFDIHYDVEGDGPAILHVPWDMTACGSSQALRRTCRR